MSISTQAVIALTLLLAGWLLSRWSARYDFRSWFTDAFQRAGWRLLRTGGWRKGLEGANEIVKSDPVLGKQLNDKYAEVTADAKRLGKTRTAIKHGGLYALAHTASLIATPFQVLGWLVLAHAAWRWLG